MLGIFENENVSHLLTFTSFYVPKLAESPFCNEISFVSGDKYFRLFAALNKSSDDFDLWIWPLPDNMPEGDLEQVVDIIAVSVKVSCRLDNSLQSKILSELFVERESGADIIVKASLSRPGTIEVHRDIRPGENLPC